MRVSHPSKSSQTFYFKFACATIAELMLTASAGNAEAPSSNTNTLPVPSPVDCSKSTLTGEKFMKMFHAIAMHGDLRDVPFIEKTLGVKFKSEHPIEMGEERNVHSTSYGISSIFDSPIGVSLDVSDDEDLKNHDLTTIGLMRFNVRNNSFFQECLHIPTSEFSKSFGVTFGYSPVMGEPLTMGAQNAGTPTKNGGISGGSYLFPNGKNGSKIEVGYIFGVDNQVVINAVITQYK